MSIFQKKEASLHFSGAVVTDLVSRDKFSAIEELVNKAPIFFDLKKKIEFINAIYQREKEKTTGFGRGIAVAHGKVALMSKICVALGISKKGIRYNSLDGKPVHLLFLIASSPEKSTEYLSFLSDLMDVVRSDSVQQQILEYKTPQEIEAFLDEELAQRGKIKVEK